LVVDSNVLGAVLTRAGIATDSPISSGKFRTKTPKALPVAAFTVVRRISKAVLSGLQKFQAEFMRRCYWALGPTEHY
jgi:hypothetical protein